MEDFFEKLEKVWEGRVWLDRELKLLDPYAGKEAHKRISKVRFLSYHVFSNYKCSQIRYSSSKDWDLRLATMIREISSYDADIICLQDVDMFHECWRTELMKIGYDSVFMQRTKLRDLHYEGVVVAYKRNSFQLFKTIPIELNEAAELGVSKGSVFVEKCKTDDVALICFLQPWQPHSFKTAICVCSAMFCEIESYSDVRFVQAEYLARQLEIANRDQNLPYLLGCSLHDTPRSSSYHVLRTGRIPLTAEIPKKCSMPTCKALCRGSVRISWFPPPWTAADPPIHTYRISWRPGGSLTLGFRAQADFPFSDCVQYEERKDANGDYRSFVLEELAHNITGLCAEMPYEFRVTAINSIGEGQWSDSSIPIVLPNPEKAVSMPDLVHMKSLPEVFELRERLLMDVQNYNVQNALSEDPLHALTNLTPRTIHGKKDQEISRGRVLPMNINPREGWEPTLGGGRTPEIGTLLAKDYITRRSILRTKKGFIEQVSDTADARIAYLKEDYLDERRQQQLCEMERQDEMRRQLQQIQVDSCISSSCKISSDTNNDFDDDNEDEFTTEELSELEKLKTLEMNVNENVKNEAKNDLIIKKQATEPEEEGRKKYFKVAPISWGTFDSKTLAEEWKSDTILDGKEIVRHVGRPNVRQVNDLHLASAYEDYGIAGEPLYTRNQPSDPGHLLLECMDYLWYSNESFRVSSLLSVPELDQLHGENSSESYYEVETCAEHCAYPWEKLFNQHEILFHSNSVNNNNGRNTNGTNNTNIKNCTNFQPFDDRSQGRKGPPSRSDVAAMKKKLQPFLQASHLATPQYCSYSGKNFPWTSKESTYSIVNHHNHNNSTNSNNLASNTYWGGKWSSLPKRQPFHFHTWLPNDRYASSHIALGAEFLILDKNIQSEWQ